MLAPEVDDVAFNRELLTTFIRKRAPALLHCYEYELKINPNTKGTLKVRFNIKPTGRATVPELEENTLGSAGLASCAKTVIGSWVFPFKPEEEVPVVSVFVFAPAQ